MSTFTSGTVHVDHAQIHSRVRESEVSSVPSPTIFKPSVFPKLGDCFLGTTIHIQDSQTQQTDTTLLITQPSSILLPIHT